jgi:hypothetical protein
MSFEDVLSKLQSPIRDLVLSASENGGNLLGNDDNDKKEIVGWIDKLSQNAFVAESNLKVRYNLVLPERFSWLSRLLIPFSSPGRTSRRTTSQQPMLLFLDFCILSL